MWLGIIITILFIYFFANITDEDQRNYDDK